VIARAVRGHAGPLHPHRNRHDYAVPRRRACCSTAWPRMAWSAQSVGKIFDVFLGRGLRGTVKTKNNAEAWRGPRSRRAVSRGLVFRQPAGLRPAVRTPQRRGRVRRGARTVRPLGCRISNARSARGPGGFFTADPAATPPCRHDHTREYVPLLALGLTCGRASTSGCAPLSPTFGQTVAEILAFESIRERVSYRKFYENTIHGGNGRCTRPPPKPLHFSRRSGPGPRSPRTLNRDLSSFTNLDAAVAAARARPSGWRAEHCLGQGRRFTGEILGPHAQRRRRDARIIGHSERRQYFGRPTRTVLQRTQAALEYGISPIVCIGELLADARSRQDRSRAGRQFRTAFGPDAGAVRQDRHRLRAGLGHRHRKDGHAGDRRRDAPRHPRQVSAKFGAAAAGAVASSMAAVSSPPIPRP